MGKCKLGLYLLVGLMLIGVVFAVSGQISSFYGESNPMIINIGNNVQLTLKNISGNYQRVYYNLELKQKIELNDIGYSNITLNYPLPTACALDYVVIYYNTVYGTYSGDGEEGGYLVQCRYSTGALSPVIYHVPAKDTYNISFVGHNTSYLSLPTIGYINNISLSLNNLAINSNEKYDFFDNDTILYYNITHDEEVTIKSASDGGKLSINATKAGAGDKNTYIYDTHANIINGSKLNYTINLYNYGFAFVFGFKNFLGSSDYTIYCTKSNAVTTLSCSNGSNSTIVGDLIGAIGVNISFYNIDIYNHVFDIDIGNTTFPKIYFLNNFTQLVPYFQLITSSGTNGLILSNYSIYNNATYYLSTPAKIYPYVSADTVSLNVSDFNDILDCTCRGCIDIGSFCNIPIKFYSTGTASINVSLTNASYEYGIDNCSNSFDIPSNATALNIGFYDISDSAKLTANITYTIDSVIDELDFSTTKYNTQNVSVCIYPAWANLSSNVNIQYNRNGIYGLYNFDTYLNNLTLILPIYLQGDATNTVTFTVKDADTSKVLETVGATLYRKIDNVWTAVESTFTDITGRVQFNYQSNVEYRFYFSKTDYTDYIFTLNPVLFSEYNVPLTRSVVLNNTVDYDKVNIYFTPTTFKVGPNNFSFIIQSPYNELIEYGYTLTYPGGTDSSIGSNAQGSQLNTYNFVINTIDVFDRLQLDYYYNTEISGNRTFTFFYSIYVPQTNHTLKDTGDNLYGMGLFERMMIATFFIILAVGIASMIGQSAAGLVLGGLLMGYFTYIGLIPLWSVLISITLILIIVAILGEK